MMKKLLVILMIIAVALGCAAVAEDAVKETFTVYPPVKAYAVFELDGNPTTGFSWTAFPVKDGIVEISEAEYEENDNKDGLVGVGGVYRFKVTAVTAGETIVLFHYARPWETQDIITKPYLVMVLEDGTMEIQDLEGFAPLKGTVVSVDQEADTVLLDSEIHGEVLARFPEDMQLPVQGENVKIWFNGVMTMSLPGQINVMGWESVAPAMAR